MDQASKIVGSFIYIFGGRDDDDDDKGLDPFD